MDSELLAALLPVVDALHALGVAYRIGGSVASSAHGVARATLDVDLMVDLREEHVAPFVARLGASYYLDPDAIRRALGERSSFNVIHLASAMKVDLFVPKARAFDREALRRGIRLSPPLAEGPVELDFLSPEDIVLLKLEWYRKGGCVSDRQWSDILGVLRVHEGRVDVPYLERWARDLGVDELLERALRVARGPD